jgi:hypothetical protein
MVHTVRVRYPYILIDDGRFKTNDGGTEVLPHRVFCLRQRQRQKTIRGR